MGSVICLSENPIVSTPPAGSRSRGVVSASGDTADEPAAGEPADSDSQPVTSVSGQEQQQEQLNVSRTIKAGRDERSSGTLLAAKLAADSRAQPSGLALKLPPIQPPASSDVVAASSDSSGRASSPSLLPNVSISEPHPPAFRGRASSPSSSPSSSPTDNTPANGPKPAPAPAARGQSPSPTCASPLRPQAARPAQAAVPASVSASAAASAPRHSPASASSSDPIDTDLAVAAAVVDRGLPSPPSSLSLPDQQLLDDRTSRKRTLEEYQSDLGTKLPSICQPAAFGGIRNPSGSPTPKDLPSAASAGPSLGSAHLLPGPPSEISDPKFTVHSGDPVQETRPHTDSPANPTLVLAHRAVAAIRNQSLLRPKAVESIFAAGQSKSNLYPFTVLRKVHDGVMDADEESDTDSVATFASFCGKRMMPCDKKQKNEREGTPTFSNPWEGAEDAPLAGPVPRDPSTPKPESNNPGLFVLCQHMGNNRYLALAEEVHSQQIDASENGGQPIDKTSNGSRSPDQANTGVNSSSTNLTSQSSLPSMRPGGGGSGDGDEDPNKRSRKLSNHEEDNDPDFEHSNRNKRRRLEFEQYNGQLESRSKTQADQDAAANSLFRLREGPSPPRPSPPPVPPGPSTFESVPSTATTMDTGPTYSETATPATMSEARSEYYKSPVETTPNNTLPPMNYPGPNHLPGKSPTSPRTTQTHATLPGVSSLLTGAEMKHSMDSPPIPSHHPQPSGGQFSRVKRVQHLNVAVAVPSTSNPTPPLPPRDFIDNYNRATHFNDSIPQYRTPRTRLSPSVSPQEKKLPPIAPAPPKFSPASIPPYFPPRNLNRPEHTTLPPIQTEWPTPVPHSEPSSAKTPTSKISKRGRNGTPKHGSVDSSQSSPSVPGGFKCTEEGCTAAPFSTQYLLNSHANVHSEDRPHFCPVPGCSRAEGGKGFKRKNEMIRHGLVHQSPGYACPFCPDKEHKYPRPDNLQRHVKAHHKDKSSDDPMLREVLAVRPEGGQRGRRRRLGPST
ncbi:hypothetical protein ABW21_db0202795 [Orbilia brochopaga]|nr:hypothetical protein ABW21_db0202795 [Drechslerella brochopaga]